MALGIVFLAYGLLHKIKPMIVTQVLWFVLDAAILTGVVLYS
jgi:VIT1/CCC1 family predicted Fe2+/Mn2+ transporter